MVDLTCSRFPSCVAGGFGYGQREGAVRQRHHGRLAIILALAVGLALGAFAAALAFFYPVDLTTVGDGTLDSIRIFLDTWKNYLLFPVAGCIVALTLLLTRSKDAAARL